MKLDEVTKHPNADTLLIAKVKGWYCIIKDDGTLKQGDLAVYIPIDAIVPDALAEKYSLEYLKKGARVRTVKLRGYVSQGLILPLDCLPPGKWQEGDDVAEVLGITKWEPPAPVFNGRGAAAGRKSTKKEVNPDFLKYTDIQNIKNYPSVFQEGDLVVVTEKVHGTNFRVGYLKRHCKTLWDRIRAWLKGPYQFLIGSHNVQLCSGNKENFYGNDVYSSIARKYRLDEVMKEYPGYELFGEIYGQDGEDGAKIQDLTYGKKELDVVFFDLMKEGKYVPYSEFIKFCEENRLPTVPLLHYGAYSEARVAECTDGNSVLARSNGVQQIREGCVVKDVYEAMHPRVGRKILKSVSVTYQLRKDGTEYH